MTAGGLCRQTCLVVGTPKGFTRSVVEALLKRGSKVLLTCSDKSVAFEEHKRLSGLYGPGQVFYSPCDPTDSTQLESVLLRALDTLGQIRLIVHSSANEPLQLSRQELTGDIGSVNRKLDRFLIQQDVAGLRRLGQLATKYMGRQQGWQGGTLLNISSSTELAGGRLEAGGCTVLGTTRGLGLARAVRRSAVKVCTVYQPGLDYTDLRLTGSAQHSTDQHGPDYTRDYTGYMALHCADTAQPGTAWAFSKEMRLEQVEPTSLNTSCGIANKMCYWLGCPMMADPSLTSEVSGEAKQISSNKEKVQVPAENYVEQEEILDS